MKVVYLAGAYRAPTEYGVHRNIQRAEQLALEVWCLGAACLCPHKNTAYMGGALPDEVWLAGDLELMARCDAVLVEPNYGDSEGTAAEIVAARELGIPVFKTLEYLKDWLEGQEKELTAEHAESAEGADGKWRAT